MTTLQFAVISGLLGAVLFGIYALHKLAAEALNVLRSIRKQQPPSIHNPTRDY